MQVCKTVFVIALFCCIHVKQYAQTVTFTINTSKKQQTIDNFGASGAWFTEGIGKYWPNEKKERIAELLFSKAFDTSGNPLGIGLSAWRFNIGGGTAEQGDSSGIADPLKRVECFLSFNGTYNWEKQAGYQWFVQKAKQYGVENLIAFSNTPPVQFTKNGLGFKLEKDYQTNLNDEHYTDYANFLATVLQHFDSIGLHFKYISPVNEPQWDWSNKFGQMNQEGTPWQNEDIYRISLALDSVLSKKNQHTRILLSEAGILTSLYDGAGHAAKQIQQFYSKSSKLYMGGLKNVAPVIAGHSYFTDNGDTNIVNIRSRLKDTAAHYHIPFWQSEYCMLADGFREGKKEKISAMDCALFLSKLIYYDLTVANASAWQFWNVCEPGNANYDARYYLLALQTNALNTQGDFAITKNLWALGHYSRFIRPGMQRIAIDRTDGLNSIQAAQQIMLSAFDNTTTMVVVAVNYTTQAKDIAINIPAISKIKSIRQYITTANAADNMKPYPIVSLKGIQLQPRSITTFVIEK